MKIIKQLDAIAPSVPDALFRRLMYDDSVGFLRDKQTIIGFEVVLEEGNELEGYLIISIQKHTVLAYRSDLDEKPKLILFPNLDKLEDPSFGMMDLVVERRVYSDDKFKGRLVAKGPMKQVASELIPPYVEIGVPDELADSMKEDLISGRFGDKDAADNPAPDNAPSDGPFTPPSEPETGGGPIMPDSPIAPEGAFDAPYEEAPFEAPFEPPFEAPFEPPFEEPFDEPFNDTAVEPEPATPPEEDSKSKTIVPITPRAIELHNQKFNAMSEVSDYVIMHFGVPPDFASKVILSALQIDRDLPTQIDIAVLLFVKLLNNNTI